MGYYTRFAEARYTKSNPSDYGRAAPLQYLSADGYLYDIPDRDTATKKHRIRKLSDMRGLSRGRLFVRTSAGFCIEKFPVRGAVLRGAKELLKDRKSLSVRSKADLLATYIRSVAEEDWPQLIVVD